MPAVLRPIVVAFALAVSLSGQSWDFSYSYRTVFDANAQDHLHSTSNAQRIQETSTISFWTPIQANLPASVRYRFVFPRPTTAARLLAHTSSWNYSLGVGDCSLWGSTDGQQWTLLLDNPAPIGRIDSGARFDAPLPAGLLGSTELWIESRMIRHGGSYPYGGAQFSRMDTTGPGLVFALDSSLTPVTAHYGTRGSSCPGSCGNPTLSALTLPRLGQLFQLRVTGICPSSVGYLFFTLDDRWLFQNPNMPLPFDLAVIGAPNCFIHVDTAHRHATMMTLSDWRGAGVIDVNIGMPDAPAVLGFEFYNQFVAIDPRANALGVLTTNAGHGIVGH